MKTRRPMRRLGPSDQMFNRTTSTNFYRAKPSRGQRKISSYLAEPGVLCVFVRVIVLPISQCQFQPTISNTLATFSRHG